MTDHPILTIEGKSMLTRVNIIFLSLFVLLSECECECDRFYRCQYFTIKRDRSNPKEIDRIDLLQIAENRWNLQRLVCIKSRHNFYINYNLTTLLRTLFE